MTRYTVRAWERFTDRTVEAAIVDTKSGDARAKLREDEDVDGFEVGTLYLRVDDSIDDALRGGNGASLYYIEGFESDTQEDYVMYHSFMGYNGHNETKWRETSDLLSTLEYIYDEGNLIPLTAMYNPSQSVMPRGFEQEVTA